LINLGSLSEPFVFTELRGYEVSFTAKVLAAVGESLIAEI
jgi:hypothetical protein